ncbi:MAG: cytochrome c3 family protein [Nitrospirota bacterium]
MNFLPVMDASGMSVVDTKHNLSITGPGPIKAAVEQEVCIFCHTPHNARSDIPYLWNRNDSTVNYITYQSSTLYSVVGQPTGASKLCLSCHDGAIALGALISRNIEVIFAGGVRFIPEGPTKLGNDLSDDHPVSFIYDSNLALQNPELVDPAILPPGIKMDSDGQLQCTACHDPHDDANGKFLIIPNNFSNLCTACHMKNGWLLSSHSTSNALWNGVGVDPWPHTSYNTVSENGCENCHRPHTAGGHERLLNFSFEEDNCIVCHNGNAASTNIENELTKTYRHPVQDFTSLHDAAEDFTSGAVPKHVECVDCHNPHQSNTDPSAGAPQVSGAVKGVKGVFASGQQTENSLNLFEICFKCHADNNVISIVRITRQIEQLNTRLEFDPSNPSFHPVETQGVNPNVPSLLPPYTTTSILFCTDCHNNDNAVGPRGPHGSNYKYMLEKNYVTQDLTPETSDNYAICYKCHDRTSILSDQSFRFHNKHIVGVQTPCSVCHDAHGISFTQGTPINNSHLINFDITIVQPDGMGRLYFEDLGIFSGRCFLNCHGRAHNETMPY